MLNQIILPTMKKKESLKNVVIAIATLLSSTNVNAQEYRENGILYSYDASTLTASVRKAESVSGSLKIPSSINVGGNDYIVNRIGESAFLNCDKVTSVEVPGSVEVICDGAFAQCYNMEAIILHEGLKWIGCFAFRSCEKLATMNFPETVTTISKSTENPESEDEPTFNYCTSLTTMSIPTGVTYIGEAVFSGCTSLKSLKVVEGNPVYDSRDNCNAIIETSTNTVICGCPASVIPHSVTKIGDYAFQAASLTSIDIPNSVESIGKYAFQANYQLVNVKMWNSIKAIEEYAFGSCFKLPEIKIPASVTSIGDYAFAGCTALTSIVSEITTPFEISENIVGSFEPKFDDDGNWAGLVYSDAHYDYVTLFVPNGTKRLYKNTAGWNKFPIIEEKEMNGVVEIILEQSSDIYSLDGKKVMNDLKNSEGLKTGVYISRGKKIYIH